MVISGGMNIYPDEIEAVLEQHPEIYEAQVPRSISWMDELPTTGSGKILKRELRQPFWADRDTNV